MTRRTRGALAATLFLAVVAMIGAVPFVFPPTSSTATGSDAVILLAGEPVSRLPVALRLAAEGPSVLVVSSAPGTANAPARALCNNPGSLIVYCFAPTPENTRGEARGIGQLVAEQGWARITVVTSTLHIARASVLIRRCTDAEVEMADAKVPLPVGAWADSVLHEVGGLAESVLRPDC